MSVLVGDSSQGGDFLRADLTGKYTAGEAPDFMVQATLRLSDSTTSVVRWAAIC